MLTRRSYLYSILPAHVRYFARGGTSLFVACCLIVCVWTTFPLCSSAQVIEFIDSGQRLGNSTSAGAALGDLDGDGDLDAFVANDGFVDFNNSQANTVWFNDGTGHFSDSGQRLGSEKSRNVLLSDVDADGDLDAFLVNSQEDNTIWLNDGTGQFIDSGQRLGIQNTAMMGRENLALGDVNGDGIADIVVPNSGQNAVWLNYGNGLFYDSGQRLGNEDSWDVALGDLDGDGDLDAVFANLFSHETHNRVWINDGTGHFTDNGQNVGYGGELGVTLGDIDGDGDLDMLFANSIASDQNSIWLNDGTGVFHESQQRMTFKSHQVLVGDVDGDGDLDALFTSASGIAVWFNDGTGIFGDSGLRLEGHSTVLGDIDSDGDDDAFVVNRTNNQSNTVWQNQSKLILTLKPGKSLNDPDLQALLNQHGITPIPLFDNMRGNLALKQALGMLRTYLLKPDSAADPEVIRLQFAALDAVEDCVYDHLLTLDYLPEDPYFHDQSNANDILLPQAWDRERGEPSVVFAFIDGPIDTAHPDLQGKCLPGRDFGGSGQQTDAYSHGTHAAGIAAASHNDMGIAGVCPGCRILPVNVISGSGSYARFDAVFRALEYAVDEKIETSSIAAMVINMSLSSPVSFLGSDSQEVGRALDVFHKWILYAYFSDVAVITSMGNLNWSTPHFPAAYHETIAIGAVDSQNLRWQDGESGSNMGDALDLVAPGVDIWSTVYGGEYGTKTGTSMAVPHVTGTAGLILSKYPQYTVEELRKILKDLAVPLHPRSEYGAGLLNADRAVGCAQHARHISIAPNTIEFGEIAAGEPTVKTLTLSPCTHINYDDIRIYSFSGSQDVVRDHCQPVTDPINIMQCDISCQITFHSAIPGITLAGLLIPMSFSPCPTTSSEYLEYTAMLRADVLHPTPTPTPTMTPTMTPTPTPTATPTMTPTPTPTMTPTPTATATFTPTSSPTPTPVSTRTAIPTPRPTRIPTPRPTRIPTPRPTDVPVPTQIPPSVPELEETATPTPTATRTATPALTPTATAAPTVTPTATTTPALTPTQTPPSSPPRTAATPTATPTVKYGGILVTATPTATTTLSTTPLPEETPVKTPTATPPPTLTPDLDATPAPTAAFTLTPSPPPTATPASALTPNPAPTASSTPTPAPTPTRAEFESPVLTVTPSVESSPTPEPTVTSTPTSDPTPISTVTSTPTPTATPEPTATATAIPVVTVTPTVTPTQKAVPQESVTPTPTQTPNPRPTVTAAPVPTISPTETPITTRTPVLNPKFTPKPPSAPGDDSEPSNSLFRSVIAGLLFALILGMIALLVWKWAAKQ